MLATTRAYHTLYDLFKQMKGCYDALIVEDNPIIQSVMKNDFEEFGYKYHFVDNPTDAIAEWKTKKYDIIVTDLHLGMEYQNEALNNGIDIARYIREQEYQSGNRTFIVLYTTIMESNIGTDDKTLFDNIFQKPIGSYQLDVGIQKLLLNKFTIEIET